MVPSNPVRRTALQLRCRAAGDLRRQAPQKLNFSESLRMKRFPLPTLFAISLVLSACASSHDLSKGAGAFGGGVLHREVRPGFYFVRSQTNWAPWSMEGSAASGWADEAKKACAGKAWKEIGTRVLTRDTGLPSMGVLKYLVSEKAGYALCEGSEISEEDASSLASGGA